VSHQYKLSKKTKGLEDVTDGQVPIKNGEIFIGTSIPSSDEFVTINTDQSITGEKTFGMVKLDTSVTPACEEGSFSWNSDDGTAQVGMPGGNVCLQLGQEMLIRAKNVSGDVITNGTPVFVSGASGNNIEIDVADASTPDANRKTVAVATEDIANNQKGFITANGFVRSVNTSSYNEGDELFVAVGGGMTNVKPSLPNGIVRIGYCTRSNASEGAIYVDIDTKSVKDIQTDTGDLIIKTDIEKTLVLEQPVYADDNVAGISLPRGAAAPDLVDYRGGTISVIAFDGSSTTEEIFWGKEYNHDGKEGVSIQVHGHFAPTTTASGDYRMFVDYDIERNGSGQVASGTLSAVKTASGVAWQSEFLDFGEIPGYEAQIGDQIGFRLYRVPTDSEDTYTDDVAVVFTFGYHYQLDTIGSRQIVAK